MNFHIRGEERLMTSIPGQIRWNTAVKDPVVIVDLCLSGCRIVTSGGTLVEDEVVFVRLDQIGSLRSRVRWSKGQEAGLQLERPLYPAVAEHLAASFPRITCSQAPGMANPPEKSAIQIVKTADRLARNQHGQTADQGPAVLVNRPELGFRLIYR